MPRLSDSRFHRRSRGGDATPVPFGLGPTVVLNMDATKLTAKEIGEIVCELRKAAGSS